MLSSEKPNALSMISEPLFGNWLANDQFEQGFIRVFASRFCIRGNLYFHWFYNVSRLFEYALRTHSLANAFSIILSALFEKWPPDSSFPTVFIRVFATRFCILRNRVSHWFYKASRRFENALRKPSLGNAFLIILGSFFDFWAQKSSFSIGFVRYFASGIRHELFTDKRKGF